MYCFLCCTACLSVQYLEELEALEHASGAAALPGKRPLTPAEQAAAGGLRVAETVGSNAPAATCVFVGDRHCFALLWWTAVHDLLSVAKRPQASASLGAARCGLW